MDPKLEGLAIIACSKEPPMSFSDRRCVTTFFIIHSMFISDKDSHRFELLFHCFSFLISDYEISLHPWEILLLAARFLTCITIC
jgi:hypothetical protein